MAWLTIGSVTVSDEWQSLPTAAVGSETIRILQTYNRPPYGHLTLAQLFPHPGGKTGFKRLIPDTLPVILSMPIPLDLRAAGQLTRHIQIRHSKPEYPDLVWSVSIEVYQ